MNCTIACVAYHLGMEYDEVAKDFENNVKEFGVHFAQVFDYLWKHDQVLLWRPVILALQSRYNESIEFPYTQERTLGELEKFYGLPTFLYGDRKDSGSKHLVYETVDGIWDPRSPEDLIKDCPIHVEQAWPVLSKKSLNVSHQNSDGQDT